MRSQSWDALRTPDHKGQAKDKGDVNGWDSFLPLASSREEGALHGSAEMASHLETVPSNHSECEKVPRTDSLVKDDANSWDAFELTSGDETAGCNQQDGSSGYPRGWSSTFEDHIVPDNGSQDRWTQGFGHVRTDSFKNNGVSKWEGRANAMPQVKDDNWSKAIGLQDPDAGTSNPWDSQEIPLEKEVEPVSATAAQHEASPWPQRQPRFERSKIQAENQDVDDVVQSMRNILFNITYEDNARLNAEDEAKVRALFMYHPEDTEKMGCGIDHIKIKRHSTFKDVRCFWVVRTDGTEIDFSYHKCVKEKVAKEFPDFVERYDTVYRTPKMRRII